MKLNYQIEQKVINFTEETDFGRADNNRSRSNNTSFIKRIFFAYLEDTTIL